MNDYNDDNDDYDDDDDDEWMFLNAYSYLGWLGGVFPMVVFFL